MKNKNIAAIMAFFFGSFGVHRFYLGQIGMGIGMIFLFSAGWRLFGWPVAAIIGVIDAIVFLSMDEKEFDKKYNKKYLREKGREREYDRREQERDRYRERRRTRKERPDYERRSDRDRQRRKRTKPQPTKRQKIAAVSPYKASGIKKFKDYDYEGAIKDFSKVLEVNPRDIAIHFNIACAYSLTENAEKAFEHLDQAVSFGFSDFDRILNHDALAYIRVQDEFETFEKNKFQLTQRLEAPKETLLDTKKEQNPKISGDLLEQLNKLGELRKKGLLTEDEFAVQKKKLLAEK
jgi:TM2 domain-containing membrane protein YozV